MSLYSGYFSVNPHSSEILDLVGLTSRRFGQFRDCFISGTSVVVSARMGGSFTSEYEDLRRSLLANPYFQKEVVDEVDPSYVCFHFQIPERSLGAINSLQQSSRKEPPKFAGRLRKHNRKLSRE